MDYLAQSGFKWALRLEKICPKAIVGLLTGLLAVAATLFLFAAVVLLAEHYLAWAAIWAGLLLPALVYWLFLSFLEQDKNLTIEEVKAAWQEQAYGKNLTFFVVRLLQRAASGEVLSLQRLFLHLCQEERFLWLLRRLNILRKDFLAKIKETYQEADELNLTAVLKQAWPMAFQANHLHVRYADLLAAIYELDQKFQKILFDFEVEEEDIREVAYWQRRKEKQEQISGKFWSRQNLLNLQGIGKSWAGGFTVNLDKYALELTELVKLHKIPSHLYGRRNQVDLLERMLIRAAGAADLVLVGPPGVGRHTILRAFAQRVASGKTYGPLRYLRLLQIDSGAVVAGSTSLNQVVAKIQELFGEALAAENVILVINDLDAFLDPNPEAGRVNATEALLPYFQSRLKIIGITTPYGYQTTIGKNPQLLKLFSKLEITEPTGKETLLILQDEVELIEKHSGLFFTHAALKEIVKLTEKLIQSLPNPEKSLEILQETAVYVATNTSKRIVLPEHVQKVVSSRTKVPVEKVQGKEKETLLNLESILQERIIGQDEALKQISDALRRARSGIRSEKKPIGSFLFLGPTGVGKTETTKALASVYFGSETRIIRLDMSEFQEVHGINRLIGDQDTRTGGLLTEAVIANPFALILLDEIEKAHARILDLFLQVLDEGRLTDALGRTVNFTNTLIIGTSNAGAELVRQMVKSGKDPAEAREELLNHLQQQGLFRPEFLNRFDAVIIFRPLGEEELVKVATLLLQELNGRLQEKDIQIQITEELALAVAKGGFSPEFGARPLRRFIQEKIENYVARGLLAGEIKRGQVVEITPEMLL